MPATIRVDLHCHSRHSDGALWPAELADVLAQRQVAVAAVVDHDTVEGVEAFRKSLARHGIACIVGVEMTTRHRGQELHLLGYGFDPGNGELAATLASVRQARQAREQPIAGVAEDLRTRSAAGGAASAAPDGWITAAEAIALVHRAGGKVFMAHPFLVTRDMVVLRQIVRDLKAAGLDGIEAIYGPYDAGERAALVELAREEELLVSVGTDFHDPATAEAPAGIDVEAEVWKPLRDAIAGASQVVTPTRPGPRPSRRRFVSHVILPAALTIVLFAVAIWGFFLPTFERSLMERKRETIRELTQSAWSILAEAHRAEETGMLSREAAQKTAAERIGAMRYGREGKDYFWVQDLTPRMIIHPYRQDLNGQDVSEFTDPRGTRVFVELADLVRRRNEGYVEYVWQWKDDPRRLALKESYIKGFAPWGWAIGTGIYIDDVHQEIARVERGLVYGSLGIVAIVSLLLLYVVRESLQLERERSEAEEHLRVSTQRYRSLVEASTEGAMLLVDGRCRYANPTLLKLLARTPQEMELLDLDDLLPRVEANAEAHGRVEQVVRGEEIDGGVEAAVRTAGGELRDCVLSLSPIRLEGKAGVILLVRDVQTSPRRSASVRTVVRNEDGQKLMADIADSRSAEEVIRHCGRVPVLAGGWLAGGMYPRHITRMVAGVCDAATARFIELAQRELGAAPAEFAWVALGSQGRQEQTLFTDQDNAILLADGADPEPVGPYFSEMAGRVCRWLDAAGYVLCRGGVMAMHEKWCQPVAVWQHTFRGWIGKAEPKELLELSIFFDLRTVYGPTGLEERLRRDTQEALAASPGFFPYFAQNALGFKPPMRLFGHIFPSGDAGMLDLKQAMMPIVNFARLYSLKHNLPATGTLDRVGAMVERELLSDTTRQDLTYAYEFLMRLRLEHQRARLDAQLPPDNSIPLRQLSHTEQALLKEAFTQIDAVQRKISYDFLGGTA